MHYFSQNFVTHKNIVGWGNHKSSSKTASQFICWSAALLISAGSMNGLIWWNQVWSPLEIVSFTCSVEVISPENKKRSALFEKVYRNQTIGDQTWLKMMRHRYTTSAMILLSQQRVCSLISIHPTKLSLTSEMPRIFTHTAIIFKKFHWQIDSTEVLFWVVSSIWNTRDLPDKCSGYL